MSTPGAAHKLAVTHEQSASVSRREIFLPDAESLQIEDVRPIRSKTRATLVAAIARGRKWLEEITTDPDATSESIAKRVRCSPRKINKTISLASSPLSWSEQLSKAGCLTAWASPACSICPPSGRASERSSA
jgi:hypothetical protein